MKILQKFLASEVTLVMIIKQLVHTQKYRIFSKFLYKKSFSFTQNNFFFQNFSALLKFSEPENRINHSTGGNKISMPGKKRYSFVDALRSGHLGIDRVGSGTCHSSIGRIIIIG